MWYSPLISLPVRRASVSILFLVLAFEALKKACTTSCGQTTVLRFVLLGFLNCAEVEVDEEVGADDAAWGLVLGCPDAPVDYGVNYPYALEEVLNWLGCPPVGWLTAGALPIDG
jgi:hypothetical protein